ncbi:MAG: site-specific integrase [Oscillospiraceae bacterium]|nr:site-specific integrase [Oscillospiraceae bacterium]
MNRNENGFGNVRQRSDGRWEARVQIGTHPDGKPIRRSLYGKTKPEVTKQLRKLLNGPKEIPRGKMSLERYITEWLEQYKRCELKPSSYDRLEITVKQHIIPNSGCIQLHAVSSADIQRHINKMLEDGYSYSTIKKVYDAYNACLKKALADDDVAKNPCLSVRLPRKDTLESKEIVTLTAEEVMRFTNEAKRVYSNGKSVYRLGYAFILILNTGIRVGEALALTWDCVDFSRKTLRIRASKSYVKNRDKSNPSSYKYVDDTTKTKSGNRIIPLNDCALEALQELHKINGQFKNVLASSSGRVNPPRNFSRTICGIYEKAGIQPSGIHALRHTFASLLFAKGTDVKYISKLLGHSDVLITYNTYIHIITFDTDALTISNIT